MIRAFGFSAAFAILGLKLIYDGWRYQRPGLMRRLGLPSLLLIVAGVLCQAPFALNLYAQYLLHISE
jgi:hypothetical protein